MISATHMSSLVFSVVGFMYHVNGATHGFLAASNVTPADVESDLLMELSSTIGDTVSQNLHELELALKPMYNSLPKNKNGLLEHSVVRYALHRLHVRLHGWYVKGLEPDGQALNSSTPERLLKEWVPTYLLQSLERQLGDRGVNLRELTALAATLEDVARQEAAARMESIYQLFNVSKASSVDSATASDLMDMYIMVYLRNGNLSVQDPAELLNVFRNKYRRWQDLNVWLRNVQWNATQGTLNFQTLSRAAQDVGSNYAFFDARECKALKAELLTLEGDKPARVPLSVFYAKGKAADAPFRFTESVDWLRDLGALDESEPQKLQVIVPNYVVSQPQCLQASRFYAVCCRNECEDLLGELEEQIAKPSATPAEVARLIESMSSSTVDAPRQLPESLSDRLRQVADANGGRVPLHSRLFAQWMHHAFPRECPFPHVSGTTNPRTPDEWMQETGRSSTEASEQEMTCHIEGPCGETPAVQIVTSGSDSQLPWFAEEEHVASLLNVRPGAAVTGGEEIDPSDTAVIEIGRTVARICAVIGLITVAGIAMSAARVAFGISDKQTVYAAIFFTRNRAWSIEHSSEP